VKQPVEDVVDAKTRVTKGKIPRNILFSIGMIAAMVVGGLGYYYQSITETETEKSAEERKAESLRAKTSLPQGDTLDDTIRRQKKAAEEEAERQRALAIKPESRSGPVMTARDFGNRAPTVSPEVAKKNEEDALFTSKIFAGDGNRARRQTLPGPDLTGVPDPAQMRAMQQAAAAAATAANAAGGVAGQPALTLTSDQAFLRQTATSSSQRTGIAGTLPACTVSQGFIIPATLKGGMNSDKPGEFSAVVSQDVYDTVRGNCLAIPKGSTMAGPYSADVAIGQERILAAFTRLQLPNGRWVPLLGMQGGDPNGEAGISGDVNNHFFKIFWGALVIGVLEQRFNNTATSTTATPGGITTYGNTAGQVAAQTAQTILNRNQNIRPTITAKSGQKILLQVKHDIVLEPYRD